MNKPLNKFGKLYALPQWKFYTSGIIALIITNYIVLEIPQLAKKIINALAMNQSIDPFTSVALAIIALGFAQVIIRTTSRVLIFWPGRTLEANIKDDFFGHVLRVSSAALQRYTIGDLTSRLNNDVTQLRIFYAFGALQVLNVICISFVTVSKMLSIDPILTALAISPMFLMLMITKQTMPKLHKSMRENTEALGRLTGKISEVFSQVHVIQTMNGVETMLKRIGPDNTAIFQSNIKTIFLRTLIWPIMTILIGISQFATLTWGGHQVISGSLTVGDIMAFNIYIGMLTFPFASIGIILNVYQRAKPASERLDTVMSLDVESKVSAQVDSRVQAHDNVLLSVKNIGFKWPDGRTALENISFEVLPRQRIGIYGAIGSGKSTLFNVITRLHQQSEGHIYLNGQDTLSISPQAVRKEIAYGLQQPLLFSESIRSNLCLGLDEEKVPLSALEAATKSAQVYEDIIRLPDTWDTLIGEKGIKLSGGQKQRLALARLLLRPAKLIILDDVLSAVDHDTEHRLIKSLLETNTALIIASHRVSILEPCDMVLVMNHGRILAKGKYHEVRHIIDSVDLGAHSSNHSQLEQFV